MTHKPNRVHKETGLIAKFIPKNPDWYLATIDGNNISMHASIVEGEGWEEEKSEIDFLYNCINEHVREWYNKNDDQEIKRMILEFAKNYKEQKS